jgi:hypothetical protein
LVRSAIYLECLPVFTRGRVALPDHSKLLRELRLLERHTHRSGKDTVDHGKHGSDDYINAVAGVIQMLTGAGAYSAVDRYYRMNHGQEAWEKWKQGKLDEAHSKQNQDDANWRLLDHLRKCGV